MQGQGFENVGGETYIWYSMEDQRDYGPRTGRPTPRAGGVGLLILGRDRFGSLSTRDPDRDATLITSEIAIQRPVNLWVNAEGVGPQSRLRLSLLDELERPVPGYSEADAAVVEGSGLRQPVTWPHGGSIAVVGRPFKIQARLEGPERNAIRLYALYLGP
jgi:hypothetical protein